MKKYVIKNCPAFSLEPTKAGNVCKKWCRSKPCQHYTDCLLKQIVERCKEKLEFLSYGIPEQHLETMTTNAERYAKAELAQEILNLLEIEEVNE